ncbi:retinal G protein coupled receptor b [Aplochiton taeniatus]
MAAYTLPEGFTEFDMFAFGTALLVGGVLGFFLNSITIMAYLRVKELRTPSNFFVLNLALADLSLNINGLVAAYASYLRQWPFGQEGCSNHGFQGMISILASISFLATIAWDRYHQHCTKQQLFWTTAFTMSFIIWTLSIFWAAVPLFGLGEYNFEPMNTCCTLDYTKGDKNYITYMVTITVLYLLFPAYTMVSNYDAIYRHFKKVHHHKFNTNVPLRVMLICWGPYVLMCMYACVDNVKIISPKLRMVLPVLAKTNPIWNAMLYSFGNEFYRAGVWKFLTGQKSSDPVAKAR